MMLVPGMQTQEQGSGRRADPRKPALRQRMAPTVRGIRMVDAFYVVGSIPGHQFPQT